MDTQALELLVVDDEEFNREILRDLLSDAGYRVALANDGEEAWQLLDQGQHHFSAILLDRMMPRLDGMGLLSRIKADKRFTDVPVIFQTSIDHPQDVAEGIKAGAFYYLVKPINPTVLFAIVQSAVSAYHLTDGMRNVASQEQAMLCSMFRRSEFQLRTLPEARTLAVAMSACYPQPQHVCLGISELLINAVEHGNLGITYQEKSRLLQEGKWEAEIERRLRLPEYANKKVEVELERTPQEIRLTIRDEGSGFVSDKYMQLSPERAFDPNGRGIALSKNIFDTLEYNERGNQLVASLSLQHC